jgi:XTP/dITP diphosphohydrolase
VTTEPLLEFLAVMRRLRAECPWKQEQTHRSLARYLLEETHETLEAIDTGDETGDWEHLREELGDLLLQVYFHAVIAEESGAFTVDDVARGITEKMYRRNPHVFGPPSDDPPADAAAVNEVWQAIKERDKPRASHTDGLPDTLPALLYAAKVLERSDGTAIRPSEPTEDNPSDRRRIGERLLALVQEAVGEGIDPEQALRDAVRRLG